MRSPLATVARNSLFIAVSTVLTKVLTFLCLFLIMRHLGPEWYGRYSVAFSLVAMLSILAEMGIATLTVRDVAAERNRAQDYFVNALILRLVLWLGTFAVVAGTVHLLTRDRSTILAAYLFALALLFDTITDTCGNLFYAFEKTLQPALVTFARAAVVLGVVALGVKSGAGLVGMVWASVAGSALAAVSLFITVEPLVTPFARPSRTFVVGLVARGLPFAAMALITSLLFRVDILMLARMRGDLETGLYAAAYRLMEALLFVSAAVNAAALPTMSRFFTSDADRVKEIHRAAFRILFILGLPIALGLTILSSRIMGVFGPAYLPSAGCLQVLAWAMFLMFLNRLAGPLLTSSGRQKLLAVVMVCVLLLNVLLNFLLIPRYGRMGASAATLFCEILLFPTFLLCSRPYQDIKSLFPGLWRSLLAGLLMFIFCWIFYHLNLMLLCVLAAGLYFFVLVAMDGRMSRELTAPLFEITP